MSPELKHWLKLKYIQDGATIKTSKGTASSRYWESLEDKIITSIVSELYYLRKSKKISPWVYTGEFDESGTEIRECTLSSEIIDEIFKE